MVSQQLTASEVSLSRGGRQILHSVSCAMEPGRVTLLTGRSGSGKSTLLSLLSGLESPDSGAIALGELTGDRITPEVGFVLQGYGLVSLLTAAENVEIGLYARGWSAEDARHRSEELLRRLGLDEVRDHLVEKMSGGQQQRVAITRALAPNPAVVLADEPTAELDGVTRALVVNELVAASVAGAVVVIATHDRQLRDWADVEIELHDGRVVTP